MKKFVVAAIAVATLGVGTLTPAEAIQGCGPYGRRNVYGACVPIGPGYGYGYGWRRPYYGWRRPGFYGWRRW